MYPGSAPVEDTSLADHMILSSLSAGGANQDNRPVLRDSGMVLEDHTTGGSPNHVLGLHLMYIIETSKPEKSRLRLGRNAQLMLCLSLHFTLVVFHLALLVIWATGAEEGAKTFVEINRALVVSTDSLLNGCFQVRTS
jgi:hypothetical protein